MASSRRIRTSAADGRERPWRARLLAFNMGDGPDAPAATQVASQLLAENMRASAEEIRPGTWLASRNIPPTGRPRRARYSAWRT